eukprot:scaffold3.g6709.t1
MARPLREQQLQSSALLVVPPFECAWLSGDEWTLKDGRGCLSFESKGDNDVTVLLKPQSGSRRWQHAAADAPPPAQLRGQQRAAPRPPDRASPVERNYTVILGSHRNSCLKFERDGELCCSVTDVPAAKLRSNAFTKYWINYDGGRITVGVGEPGTNICHSWADPEPIDGIRHVGLSAWDKHVGYRSIRMHPPLALDPQALAACGDGAAAAAAGAAAAVAAVPSLVEQCCRALRVALAPAGVCGVLEVADCLAPVVDGLRGQAIDFLAAHFQARGELWGAGAGGAGRGEVVACDLLGFSSLSAATLAEVLCSGSLNCEEKAVFDAVALWAGYGQPLAHAASACRPLQEVEALLPHTRFPLMGGAELAAVSAHPLAARCPLLRELVGEAQEALAAEEAGGGAGRGGRAGLRVDAPGALGAPRGRAAAALAVEHGRHVRALTPAELAASARFQRRHAPGCAELIYMYDGDHNGVCWFLGTAYGTQQWVNPMTAGRLQARASSPACRGTDPRALVSGAFLRTNFAGPRLEGGQPSSWWLLDLGGDHSLIANYYTLRHDGSSDFLRSWILQGSNDGAAWTDLRRHLNDVTLSLPGQYASWPVTSHASAVPYRLFRVLLAAPSPEAANPRHVSLSGLELYGYFYRRGGFPAAG